MEHQREIAPRIAPRSRETVSAAAAEAAETSPLWSQDTLGLHAVADSAGAVRVGAVTQGWDRLLPLVEVTVTGHGRNWSGERFIDSAVGSRLAYREHETVVDEGGHRTTILLADPVTGLDADHPLFPLVREIVDERRSELGVA